jgi:hypothetical protein
MTEPIWIRLNTNKNKKMIKPGQPGGSTIDPDEPINQPKKKVKHFIININNVLIIFMNEAKY